MQLVVCAKQVFWVCSPVTVLKLPHCLVTLHPSSLSSPLGYQWHLSSLRVTWHQQLQPQLWPLDDSAVISYSVHTLRTHLQNKMLVMIKDKNKTGMCPRSLCPIGHCNACWSFHMLTVVYILAFWWQVRVINEHLSVIWHRVVVQLAFVAHSWTNGSYASCGWIFGLVWEMKADTVVIYSAVALAFLRRNGLNVVCVCERRWVDMCERDRERENERQTHAVMPVCLCAGALITQFLLIYNILLRHSQFVQSGAHCAHFYHCFYFFLMTMITTNHCDCCTVCIDRVSLSNTEEITHLQ